ncbi:cytochrome P450 [Kitasatospora aureofaciens]|uniref:cytochrome P450 n=1 Tax=Kitasatospora aureofaciens TaxID=1894 RepID=UPI0037CC7448
MSRSEDLPDLTDGRLYSEGDPHTAWRRWRTEAPVAWHEPMGFWAVTGHEPAKEVLSDWRRFTSTNGTVLRPDTSAPFPGAGRMLVLTDPPRHTEIRRAIAHLFKPRAVAQLQGVAREVVRDLLEQARSRQECDFVEDVAAKIPLAVLAGVLGILQEDVPAVADAAARAAAGGTDVGDAGAVAAHNDVMLHYYRRIRAVEREPGDDLVSALVTARQAGLELTDEEILLTCDNVVVAATETATQAVSGGLLALLERPAVWDGLRAGRFPLATAAEEILRWTSPATHIMRTAVADTRMGDAEIKAGDAVAVWVPSANRDESVFVGADELRLDREPNPHLAFGAGTHFCIGAAVVRVVLIALLEELISLRASVSLAGSPRHTSSWAVWGLASLPIAFGPHDTA